MAFRMEKLKQLWRLVRESHAEPLKGEPRKPEVLGVGEQAVTFIGHSSFLVQMKGLGVLIDPVFATRLIVLRRQRRAGVKIKDLPAIDAVLLTHAHMDHLNRPSLRAVVKEMKRRGRVAPVAVVPNGVADLVADLGFSRVVELRWWEAAEVAGLQVTATPARHWGARMFKDTHRGFGGYVLEGEGAETVYHSGDTAYFGGFAEIGRRLKPSIALLPIGAYFPDSYRSVHTSPEEALQGFLEVGAETMVPMHYNTFRLGREPMDEPMARLLVAAEKAGVLGKVEALGEGERLLVGGERRLTVERETVNGGLQRPEVYSVG
jgi:L-ascorbate metabolism protein UlaG (beta-lactamase superfamily)